MAKINKKYDNMLLSARDVGVIRKVTQDKELKAYYEANKKRLKKMR
jgi:hypothetical protein